VEHEMSDLVENREPELIITLGGNSATALPCPGPPFVLRHWRGIHRVP
jgi:hypothetical protein